MESYSQDISPGDSRIARMRQGRALRQHEKSLSGSFDRLKPARDIFPRRLVYCFMWLSAPLFLPERPGAFLLLALLGRILFPLLLNPCIKYIGWTKTAITRTHGLILVMRVQ